MDYGYSYVRCWTTFSSLLKKKEESGLRNEQNSDIMLFFNIYLFIYAAEAFGYYLVILHRFQKRMHLLGPFTPN